MTIPFLLVAGHQIEERNGHGGSGPLVKGVVDGFPPKEQGKGFVEEAAPQGYLKIEFNFPTDHLNGAANAMFAGLVRKLRAKGYEILTPAAGQHAPTADELKAAHEQIAVLVQERMVSKDRANDEKGDEQAAKAIMNVVNNLRIKYRNADYFAEKIRPIPDVNNAMYASGGGGVVYIYVAIPDRPSLPGKPKMTHRDFQKEACDIVTGHDVACARGACN